MRFIRFLIVAIGACWRPRLRPDEQSEIELRVWLTDVDLSVANNAAYLVYFESGRLDLQLRTGFAGLALKHGWLSPMRSVVIEFWKPLKRFQKFRLTTKVIYWDHEWIHFDQQIERDGVHVASALTKAMVLGRGGRVAPTAVGLELGFEDAAPTPPPFISKFQAVEELLRRHTNG